MPEFFLELFSEEIPARMQAQGAADLARLVADAIAALTPATQRTWHGPRRIAYAAEVAPGVAASRGSERGPRISAPEQAIAGFLRKHGATRDDLRAEGDFWMLERATDAVTAARLIAEAMPRVLRRMPWPKSMRWGTSRFTWVRPLRRIVCLLDGEVVPFALAEGGDDAHGLASDNLTEGHRFMAPGAFAVESAADWEAKLRARFVEVDSGQVADRIWNGLRTQAEKQAANVVRDAALMSEVIGLVEWPVPFLGRIDPDYMDLPSEVRQVSMRVNQRAFALTDKNGKAAPWFGFVANIEPTDRGAATIAGNERVLRARFADARHFWDRDRKTKLIDRVDALKAVIFHAKLGSVYDRAHRIASLAEQIAPRVGADPEDAKTAGLLAKADLTTGMVSEFPELQGVMGSYYAAFEGEKPEVVTAIRDHYAPRNPSDLVPTAPVTMAVALADKIDQLTAFFLIEETPTGSSDPYALRRAALGVIKIIRQTKIRLSLTDAIYDCFKNLVDQTGVTKADQVASAERALARVSNLPVASRGYMRSFRSVSWLVSDILTFLAERLRVQLRGEGARYDVLDAVLATGLDDDIIRLLARTDAVTKLVSCNTGKKLLAGYRRAANIVRIEQRKDDVSSHGPFRPDVFDPNESPEIALSVSLGFTSNDVRVAIEQENFSAAIDSIAALCPQVDLFLDTARINGTPPDVRRNRLALLEAVCMTMNQVADFSKIEG